MSIIKHFASDDTNQDSAFEPVIRHFLSDENLQHRVVDHTLEVNPLKSRPSKDVRSLTDTGLRARFYKYKRHGITIDPAMQAELVRRFPTYDPDTQNMSVNLHKAPQTLSDAGLLARFYKYKRSGMPVDEETQAELARRFPTYQLGAKYINKNANTYVQPATNCTASPMVTDNDFVMQTIKSKAVVAVNETEAKKALKRQLRNCRKRGVDVPDDLNAALAAAYPGQYDPASRKFIAPPKKGRKVDFGKITRSVLHAMYKYRKRNNKPIEPDMDAALARLFGADYDRETQTLNKTKRSPDLTTASVTALMGMVYYRKRNGLALEPELQAALMRIEGYDPATNRIVVKTAKPKRIKPAPVEKDTPVAKPQPGITTEIVQNATGMPTTQKSAKDKLLDKYHQQIADGFISPDLNAELSQAFPDIYDSVNQVFTGRIPTRRPRRTNTGTPSALHVKLEPVATNADNVYNNVIVNGNVILKNHANTELHPLLDGTLLGVYGTICGNDEWPEKPTWLLFNTQLRMNTCVPYDLYAGQRIYIQSLVQMPNAVRVVCSSKCDIYLALEKYRRLANGARFIIDGKTK